MCGADSALTRSEVEGVEMSVCSSCAPHGTRVQKKTYTQVVVGGGFQQSDAQIHPDYAKILTGARAASGKTQEELAQSLNMKVSVWQHFESGKRQPSIETARKLERELGVSLVVKFQVGNVSVKAEGGKMTMSDFFKK